MHAAVAAIDRHVRRERVATLLDLRYAWAEGKDFQQHVRQLQHTPRATAEARPTNEAPHGERAPLSAQQRGR
jgi:hypothetical protein